MNKTYIEKLEDWFQKEKAAGRLVDLKFTFKTYEEFAAEGVFFTDEEKKARQEASAKAIYETLTGKRRGVSIKNRKL